MPVDPKLIKLELQAVAGALRLAETALARIQGQMPPGSPDAPTAKQLGEISASAESIQQTANSIAKIGGTGKP